MPLLFLQHESAFLPQQQQQQVGVVCTEENESFTNTCCWKTGFARRRRSSATTTTLFRCARLGSGSFFIQGVYYRNIAAHCVTAMPKCRPWVGKMQKLVRGYNNQSGRVSDRSRFIQDFHVVIQNINFNNNFTIVFYPLKSQEFHHDL